MSAPSPQPSPLKQIIEVKARALCTTLGANVQVALVGLMKNDQVIEAGRRAFAKMAWDQAQRSKALPLDRLGIRNVVYSMVHNLDEIDRALTDPARFPAYPSSGDERSADQIKAALQAVEDDQKRQLNVFSGMVETDELSAMRHEYPDFNPTVNSPNQSSVAAATPAAITDAGIAQPKPAATVVPATGGSRTDYGVAATSPQAAFATMVANGQTRSTMLESDASSVILPIARDCRNSAPAVSPPP